MAFPQPYLASEVMVQYQWGAAAGKDRKVLVASLGKRLETVHAIHIDKLGK